MEDNRNKRAIIVGATSGIGKEIALYFASQGWSVAALGRRRKALDELSQQNSNISIYEFDLNEAGILDKRLDEIANNLGDLDLLVVSAGVGFLNIELDLSVEQQTIKTNIEGFTGLMSWGYKHFKKKGSGHIAAITSVQGLMAGGFSYSASKAYQINYMKTLRMLAKKEGFDLTVTDIRPGSVDTDMMKGEGHFWISKPEYAAQLTCKAILKKKRVQYISRRWVLIGALLKILSLWG